MDEVREYNHRVRIYDTDVEGRIPLRIALTHVTGIGRPMALRVIHAAGMDPNMRVGYLTEEEIEKLVDIMLHPDKYGLPRRTFNRPRDPYYGSDRHLLSTDLLLEIRQDIERMIRTKSRKGIRHARGLKVRGQRTKTASKRTDRRVSEFATKKEEKKRRRKR